MYSSSTFLQNESIKLIVCYFVVSSTYSWPAHLHIADGLMPDGRLKNRLRLAATFPVTEFLLDSLAVLVECLGRAIWALVVICFSFCIGVHWQLLQLLQQGSNCYYQLLQMSGSDKSPYVPKNKKNSVQEQSGCYALDQCKGRLEHHKSDDEQDIQNQGPSITAQVFVLFCFVFWEINCTS
jgi:hypothetical protein